MPSSVVAASSPWPERKPKSSTCADGNDLGMAMQRLRPPTIGLGGLPALLSPECVTLVHQVSA